MPGTGEFGAEIALSRSPVANFEADVALQPNGRHARWLNDVMTNVS
jgi:hypothetical protein